MTEPNQEWQAPPPPETPYLEKESPQMSEAATLGNIFFEPGKTFEDLRRKPRFIYAVLITIVFVMIYSFAFQAKVGEEGYKRFVTEQLNKNPQVENMPAEQKQAAINMQLTIIKYIGYALPVFILIGVALGGLCYWLGAKVMGGDSTYLHGLSIWVYSGFPPMVLGIIANFVVLALKSADDIDIATSQNGVIQASLGALLDGKEMPVLVTLLNTFNFFSIWGWVLAAIGLNKAAKLSKGSAWTVVIIFALIGVAWKVISSLLSGNPS